ncbi:MAG: hypothetical protein GY810_17380 [Aureispira sp.]|nr:hypothetical protein [Aureispira sp.]
MKRILTLHLLIAMFFATNTFAQNVGIDIAAPTSKLHVVQTAAVGGIEVDHAGATGNSLVVFPQNAANTDAAAWIINFTAGIGLDVTMFTAASTAPGILVDNGGAGIGQVIDMTNTTSTSSGLFVNNASLGNGATINMLNAGAGGTGVFINQDGTDAFSRGIELQMDAASIALGVGIFHSGAGMGQLINMDNPTSTASALRVNNTNLGDGVVVTMANTGAGGTGTFIDQDGTDAFSRGIELQMDAASIALGVGVFQAGAGTGQVISMTNATSTSSGLFVNNAGLGMGHSISMTNTGAGDAGVYIAQAGTGGFSRGLDIFMGTATNAAAGVNVYHGGVGSGISTELANFTRAMQNNLTAAGGYGVLSFFNGEYGIGYYVDSIADGFAFQATVNSATPTIGTLISGAVFSGTQQGVGHGILLNHNGTQGRNAEFNITNPANNDYAVFITHEGVESAMRVENQGAPPAQLNVAEFEYSGTHTFQDHVAVFGRSTPAVDYGIGVQGTGNWYGVEGIAGSSGVAVFGTGGDVAATGVKSFYIDHPQDPENKILRHYAIESNEVLNMYRGIVKLDANGEAMVQLPDYFEAINKDYSYQLTPIGTGQQPYIATEISNNEFKVAGAPNSKVSWTVHAQRNDPYVQQNKAKLVDVIEKTADRKGKYLTPELYGQPMSKSMTPRSESKKVISTTTTNTKNKPQLSGLEKGGKRVKDKSVEANKTDKIEELKASTPKTYTKKETVNKEEYVRKHMIQK